MNEKTYKDTKRSHDKSIAEIKGLDDRLNSLAPFELAKLEYLYTKVERHAWTIAGYFRNQAKYYEGMAEVAQGSAYKSLRQDGKSAQDAQYEARVAKGNMLTKASDYDGEYIAWKGWAASYEGARNAIKDMIKGISAEGGS
ncbi:hypothetical protein LRR81_08755 [Metabacillus sp. GX 13764]|uniref:hypothetical protein n=1 Tax=Metabacillus kandeliae TaxID=2900151 RepID=UPI001E371747|nr:hypothetical protein [Metabacillus kandeliae]MCD7034323.1 hypothetical protein [Metabacillus kandeliae]